VIESPSLLLVEDDEDTCKMLALLFEEWGYRATIVNTATEGLRLIFERRFEIIILDNWLPDLDGIELCRQIRAVYRKTPIIFYSAATMGSEDREALSCGANAYIYKGTGIGLLRQAIVEQLCRATYTPKKS
jgi:DNA-binding response OmpR family regulator